MPMPWPWPWPWPPSAFGRGAPFLLGGAQLFSLFGCLGRGVVRGFLDLTRGYESLGRFAVPARCGVVAFALQRWIASVGRRAWAVGLGLRRSDRRWARQWLDRGRLGGRLLCLHDGAPSRQWRKSACSDAGRRCVCGRSPAAAVGLDRGADWRQISRLDVEPAHRRSTWFRYAVTTRSVTQAENSTQRLFDVAQAVFAEIHLPAHEKGGRAERAAVVRGLRGRHQRGLDLGLL